MSYSGILGAIIIIVMLIMGVWFGCKGEKEGGGRSQYEENIEDTEDAVGQFEEAQEEKAQQAKEELD